MPERRIRCGNDPRIQLTDGDRVEVEKFTAYLKEKQAVQPTVVCICGSMRFQAEMAEAAHAESLAGRIVVMPHVNMKQWPGNVEDMDAVKTRLDLLHRAKIRLAQEVLVAGRLRYCADQLAITNGLDTDDRTRLLAVQLGLEELADELDKET